MASTSGIPDSGLRREKYARRQPVELAELTGPTYGTVTLPVHLAWAGLARFDLDQPRLRMSYYRIILAEGMHDDLVHYLNHSLLISLWPVLRTLISRDLRDAWENTFPELASAARTAA